ncbi:alpha/beta hydrolase fold domain-containing protein [Zhongshania sp.]|uniref:alpha/beta hydrolase fold domain-containing protein n=1 Tax=Zhongshania sp. TaxID=1971902 RepID=UPI00356A82D7
MKLIIFSVATLFVVACAGTKLKGSSDYSYVQGLSYKTVNTQSLGGDLYIPNTSGLKPAVVVVHGGGWTNRSGDMGGISRRLAKAGFVVFNITYRLAPEHRHPAQIEDVSAALEWLYSHAGKYQIDQQRISGWGYSAGAHLILMAGLNRQQPPYLSSIVAGGTPADLTAWPNSPLVLKLIGEPMSEAKAAWQNASPVNHVSSNSPPVFLYHGQWDTLVEIEQMTMMKSALAEKNIPVESYTVKFLGHVATYALAGGAEQRGIEFTKAQFSNALKN